MADPPESSPPDQAAATGPGPSNALRNCRVLVVDDDPDVVRVVSKRLQRVGCVVESAPDGEAALHLLIADPKRWHVVLTDQTMPHRTGEQLLRALREAGIGVPVVVMSGYSATATPERVIALGASAVLAKPFGGDQLVAALTAALRR